MNGYEHRVTREPVPTLFALPAARWRGKTYVTPDGIELVVVCSGKMESEPWPDGSRHADGPLHRIQVLGRTR